MKYSKYITGVRKGPFDNSGRTYRVYFRRVFARLLHETLHCCYVNNINTGVSFPLFFSHHNPKRSLKQNYKNLYREYNLWNGEDNESI